MLPEKLRGPGMLIGSADADLFIEEKSKAFPYLDKDFISQLCYELPGHLDSVLPRFDPKLHGAFRITRTAGWVLENVLYYDGRDVFDEWCWQVDEFLDKRVSALPVLDHMLKFSTWSFPPVVIEASFARTLALPTLGGKYFLVEGTHRVSYLSRLVQLGRIALDHDLELIEISALNDAL